MLVKNVLRVQIMTEVSEPTVKTGENNEVNSTCTDIINEALKVVSFQFLSGDSVINVCVNENHVLMTVYVFLPCC